VRGAVAGSGGVECATSTQKKNRKKRDMHATQKTQQNMQQDHAQWEVLT